MLRQFLAITLAAACLLTGGIWSLSVSKESDDKSPEDKALVETAEALVAAFNRGDAKAIAGLWSENGVYIHSETGERIKGRVAIAKEYASHLAEAKGAELRLNLESIRLVTADVASVDGTAKVLKANVSATENRFSMMLVKKEGKWLIDSVRETEATAAPAHYDYLKDLEWMIGEWVDTDDDVEVSIVCTWATNRNFMNRFFTVKVKDVIEHQGTQVIGWDPIQMRIRSWVFDSDGTFGEGVWQRDGNRWIAKVQGVLPGGKRSTATQIITKVDDNKYTWQQQSRAVDGRLLPNSDEVTMVRTTRKEKE